jgi:hypothetical protein
VLAAVIGERALQRELSRILRRRQDEISTSPDAIKWYPNIINKIDPAGVITTNWDTLLEASHAGRNPLKWPRDCELVRQAHRMGEPFLLYLHGNINDEDLVATSRSRDSVKNRLLLDVRLQQLLVDHYTFVIGYGFPDDHVVQAFEDAFAAAGATEQIAYVIEREASSRRAFPPTGATVGSCHDFNEFQAALNNLASLFDPSVRLLKISEATSADALRAAVDHQVYNYETTSSVRDAIRENRNPDQILNFSAELILDDPQNIQRGGILATVISQINDLWKPDPTTLRSLGSLAEKVMKDDNFQLVGTIEPLSFTLGVKGTHSHHRDYLRRVIDNYPWRNADEARIRGYYGRGDVRIRAYQRHHKDPRRTGTLLANDITRIVNSLETEYQAAERLLPQLDAAIDVLDHFGESDAVKRIVREADQVRRKGPILRREDALKWKDV